MKSKIYILFVLLFSALLYGCNDDLPIDDPNAEEENRLFMPMFRQNANTNQGDSDPYRCQPTGEYGNDIFISWYEIDGAAAYRIRMKIKSGSWDLEHQVLLDTIVPPGTFSMIVEDLQYGVNHNFAIQALYTETGYIDNDVSKGEHPWNSLWYGIGDAGHNDERVEVITLERDDVPEVMSKEGNIGYTEAEIYFNLNYEDNPTTNTTFEYDEETGLYYIDEITIEASDNPDIPIRTFTLSEEDKKRGFIVVDGLISNQMYIVNGVNNRIDRYWDRLYNTMMMRMKGDPGEPVLLTHIVDTLPAARTHQASRIDTILTRYMSDNELAEGTIFVLESGKNYYIQSTVEISKGLVLKSSDPSNPATIMMGLGWTDESTGDGNAYNFSLGRNAQAGEMGSIDIQSIVFQDIHFTAPYALNIFERQAISASQTTGKGNYFINQSSSAMEFYCESLEMRGCTFQQMIRGWFRVQGTNKKIIKNIVVDDCMFYNTGYYSADGRGYPVFACNENSISAKTNIFQNIQVTNSSFIGGSYDHFFNEPNPRAWPSNINWDITLMNNTFLNWMCMSNGRLFINTRYNPDQSRYTVKNNLFILTKSDNDPRGFRLQGMNVQNRQETLVFDFENNWSTNTNLQSANQIFSSNPFSSTSQGAGFDNGRYNVKGMEETLVHVDDISPVQLMVSPNPLDIALNDGATTSPRSANTFKHNVPDGIYYQNTPAVRNSEIYKRNIGDPRWRKNVTP